MDGQGKRTQDATKKYKNMRYALVRTSIDDIAAARDLAKQAIDLKLATSIHIRQVESIYVWEGEFYDHPEYEVEFMTTVPCVDALVEMLVEKHPYDCAEVIKTGFQTVNDDFTVWINESVSPPGK